MSPQTQVQVNSSRFCLPIISNNVIVTISNSLVRFLRARSGHATRVNRCMMNDADVFALRLTSMHGSSSGHDPEECSISSA